MSKEAMKLALEDYLSREMPAGTVIGDPKWWAGKIANVLAKQEQGEPVMGVEVKRVASGGFTGNVWWIHENLQEGVFHLYTTPYSWQQRPAIKPLTDEQARAMWPAVTLVATQDIMKFVRALEAAHGIKE